jgi:hypothetical protein
MAAFFAGRSERQPQPGGEGRHDAEHRRVAASATAAAARVGQDGARPLLPGRRGQHQDREARRPYLAKWLATAENPYFAKAFVNRTWAPLRQGFVTWVDDITTQHALAPGTVQ